MRILRLYAPLLTGEHTLCWVSGDDNGKTFVNDAETVLRAAYAGDEIKETDASEMTVVLPRGAELRDGCFLSVTDRGALLRWNERDKRFLVAAQGFLSVSAKADIWEPLKTAVLTVSDKGSRGERRDTSGPALVSLSAALGCVTEATKTVPDNMAEITDAVTRWSDEGYHLVLVTGGTGLAERDVTPEALMSIAEKTVPGFGEVMRSRTLVYTPRAFLTRSVAVVRKKTLIIAFPGSEKAVRQCFEAISGGLRHGVETLAGLEGAAH